MAESKQKFRRNRLLSGRLPGSCAKSGAPSFRAICERVGTTYQSPQTIFQSTSAERSHVSWLMPQRDFYIDRLRSAMTMLVIFHHTAITYGAMGGWFYHERKTSGAPSSLLLTLFCATNQAYFMGFFFLLAGFFTPGSLERKGYRRFIIDRFLRLGLPLL